MTVSDAIAKKDERLSLFHSIDIYPVTCERLSNSRSDLDILHAVIKGGAKIIQLRDKESTKEELLAKAKLFREITTKSGVLLIINDHVDIARAVDADGVHLGINDLSVRDARALLPDKLIGASTHSLQEATNAQADGADYVNIGPIFPTKTKDGLSNFVGPDMISAISKEISIPFTVMGGINSNNLDQVLSRGARKIAMVTAITMAKEITATVRDLRQRIIAAGTPKRCIDSR